MKLILSIIITILSATALAEQALILRPEISPNGEHIAFSYQGDIWRVSSQGGRADRLTIHEGYESHPAWSPSSDQIAFSSDRFGNDDVFIMPAEGGKPKRLTYHSASDAVSGFTNTGEVLFNSRRVYAQVEREPEILAVNAFGNTTESRFLDALGFDATVSPDGSKVAFVRGTARTSREEYRGPANRNIWIYSFKDDEYELLIDHDSQDFMPKWVDNDTLYYLSSRNGKYNVYQAKMNGKTKQITQETEFGVNHFSVSAKGQTIVYQAGGKVVRFDLEQSLATPIEIDVNSDFRFDPIVSKTLTNDIDEYSVSPNAKLSAYVLRGDIYVTRNDKEDSRSVRLTQGAARDRDPVWLSDTHLLFVSDREGQNDLYLIRSDDPEQEDLFRSLKHKIIPLTSSPEEETSPLISPNKKHIAYLQGRGKLQVAKISEDGILSEHKLLLDGWDTPSGLSWSPDSRWLAYSLSDLNFNEEIYIHAADNSIKPVNISMHPKYDVNPVWSPDGSKLGFSSMRNNGDFDIWFVWLKESDWQRSKEQWRRKETLEEDKPNKSSKNDSNDKSDSENAKNDEAEEEIALINIDFDGIYKRLEQVTRYAGNESELMFTQDGEHIYYTIGGSGRQTFEVERNLYKIKWDGEDKTEILGKGVRPSNLVLADKGKYLFALTQGGKMVRINTKDDKSDTLAVSSQSKIDRVAELEQIFDDAWRALNAGFYDPDFHGKDWSELRKKYKPLALKASTKEDFQYIFNLMLGQVNASHMGLFRGENPKQTQTQQTGLLGIEGVHTDTGFEVKSVLKNSPADRDDSKLMVGDVITKVNQQSVQNTNFYSLLIDLADNPVLLEVVRANQKNDKAKNSATEIVIWPSASLSNQLYDGWVDERRRLTEQYSKGRLGYLHIRGMNWTSFERFERELMAAGYGKDGIVIDVRYNGGGWTTDYLMAVLNVKQHAYTIPRGAASNLKKEHKKFEDAYPYSERLPLSAWTKPSIAMSNENSYSNAEIFSHAYKALDIGKLVGRPTFGAVISTGAYGLVDGSIVRMPFRGWWVKESGDNMDFVPAKPDIEVFNPPAYKAKGIDPQLKRAVDELVKQVRRKR